MILFYNDWKKYPKAIVHVTTKNTSFIEIAKTLKLMGVKNHTFMLSLLNPILEHIDPFDPNLTSEMKGYIAEEVTANPWYFIREVVRVLTKSGVGTGPFLANRGNIALFWLFFTSTPQLDIQPRQTGKTYGVATLFRGLLNFWLTNTQVNLLTKDVGLRVETVETMKTIGLNLPEYLSMSSKKDTDNREGVTVELNGNKYKTTIAQSSLAAALNAARGLTSSTFHIDEFAYIYNIRNMLAPALASGAKARANAKEAHMPYGTVFTTTSGRLDVDSGAFAYELYMSGAEFTERVYDLLNKSTVMDYVKKHTLKGRPPLMVCEFNHRQLGYTDKWLVDTMNESFSTGIDAEADFLNKWPEGGSSSPLDGKYLTMITESERETKYLGFSGEGLAIRWQLSEQEVKTDLPHRSFVIGLDTSDAVGQDDIALVARDITTGEVIGAGQYNNLNIIHFGEWMGDLLIKYPKSILIIERRSTGSTIIDKIILKLLEANIDPFTRMFNWVVNDSDVNSRRYDEISGKYGKSGNIYTKYRSDFGFATSGGGRTARSRLYGETLLDSVKFTGGAVRDKRLIKQISGLREKNNRIDHTSGSHDDLVIAWLLTYWFLSKAKNVKFYGIRPEDLLSKVIDNSPTVENDLKDEKHKQEQVKMKSLILQLIERVKVTKNPIIKQQIIIKLKQLESKIDKAVMSGVNIEVAISEVLKSKETSSHQPSRRRMNNKSKYW